MKIVMPLCMALSILIGHPASIHSKELPTVDSVLERYISAIGGRAVLETITSRHCSGTETVDFGSRSLPIFEIHPFIAWTRIPDHIRFMSYSDGETRDYGYDGTTGWSRDKCGTISDSMAGQSKLDWLLNPQYALHIQDYFPELNVTGLDQVNGQPVYVLESSKLKKAHYGLYFSVDNGLLLRIGYYVELHDYCETDGILFPHTIIFSRKGGSVTYEIENISHDVTMPDSIFTKP